MRHKPTVYQAGAKLYRTDIGGAYRTTGGDNWTPLLDWVGDPDSNYMGVGKAQFFHPTDNLF